MRLTAESYGGYLSWDIADDEFVLTIMIPIGPNEVIAR